MPDKEEYPIDYRRYAAQIGFPITPGKEIVEKQAQEGEEPPREEKAPSIPPIQRLRMLESKVKDKLDDVKLLNEFIKLGYELKEYKLIEEYMRQYLGRHPRDNGIRQSLAMVLIRTGNRKRAKVQLRKILEYNPKFAQARELLERIRKGEM